MSTDTQVQPGSTSNREAADVADEILASQPILSDEEIGHYARALVKARLGITAFVSGCVVAAVTLALVLPEKFTAKAVILPVDEGEKGFPSQLSGLASSFGMQFPFGSVSQSDLYPTILRSDRILDALLDDSFVARPGEAAINLVDHLVRRKKLSAYEHRKRALKTLREDVVRANKDKDNGIVTLQVTTDSPALSADVANRLTSRLEAYLIETRQTEGAGNRAFLDQRLVVVDADLETAEEDLKAFREANRRIGDSPELLLQQDRLRRELLVQEQIFLELKRQQEVAKIEEVKNTPVLRVLDHATAPIRPSHPQKVIIVVMGLVLGLLASTGWVIGRTVLELSPHLAGALRPFASDARKLRGMLGRRKIERAN